MNAVFLCGRTTKDPEVRYTAGDNPMAIARYTLAVDRRSRKTDGEQSADFINCTAFGKSAEFVEKYVKKGTKLIIRGHIQTGSYTNREGQKVYTTEVVVDDHEVGGSKQSGEVRNETKAEEPRDNDFMNLPDDLEDEGLPFNSL